MEQTSAPPLIPNRFESLREAFGDEVRPLIVPVDADVKSFLTLRDQASTQNGGILAFLTGKTGTGKTTSVFATSANAPDHFTTVLEVPRNIDLRAATSWIKDQIPPPEPGRTRILLLDGREVTDDKVGLKQFITAANQVLRIRSDIILCWPTPDEEWHRELRELVRKTGGTSLCPPEADVEISGPPKDLWTKVLERLLLQRGLVFSDVGLTEDWVEQQASSNDTVGDFLRAVGSVIAQRVTKTREIKQLPQIVFIVTSSGDILGQSNAIRRAGTQTLGAEPLLAYSPRSNSGRWWNDRSQKPEHHLGYIISLFEAKLLTAGASAVVHACLNHGEAALRKKAEDHEVRQDAGNAGRTIQATEFYRYLVGERTPEYTTGRKGEIAEATIKAYDDIQAMSAKRHKAINQAIVRLVQKHLPDLECDDSGFEIDQGAGALFADCVPTLKPDKRLHLEFHHVSAANCTAANLASYIMDKLRAYAIHYNLVPR